MKRAAALLALLCSGCATRGHIATPADLALLKEVRGLSASGRLTLSGPAGRFSTRLVFGVARPDALRIEIPAGAGLRFLLVAKEGRLRADLPPDDAMFEGASTRAVMASLFGIDFDPRDLVGAVLGSPPDSLRAGWRFDRELPSQVILHDAKGATLTLSLDDPNLQTPGEAAFDFGAPRGQRWTLEEMSARLGLRR